MLDFNSFACWWIFRPHSLNAVVAQRVERWTCDQQVVGSNPARSKAA